MPDDEGRALISQLEHLAEHHGEIHPLIFEANDIPIEGEGLWAWFWELNAARGGNGFALSPIGYSDIETWARMTQVELSPTQIAILRSMDQSFLMTQNELAAERAKNRQQSNGR